MAARLVHVSTSTLERLLAAIMAHQLDVPVTSAGLLAFGIKTHVRDVEQALKGHGRLACRTILETTLAERHRERRPSPELVWTGPEGKAPTARDTAIVLRELFESARERVLVAGYRFSHAETLLRPLHEVMREHGVEATFFIDVDQAPRGTADPQAFVEAQLAAFVRDNWPFGAPMPRIHYDLRALAPGPPFVSLHAKCVVVDERLAFVSSANFTERGHERNIEVGVLLHDTGFATSLAAQWRGLVGSGQLREYVVGPART